MIHCAIGARGDFLDGMATSCQYRICEQKLNWIRGFSVQSSANSGARNLEDAPQPMRQELVDLFFGLAEHHDEEVPSEHVYRVTCQSLGISSAGVPYSGFRYAAGRDIGRVEWPRVYDLIVRLWPDFDRQALGNQFREGVNRILAAYGVAWELEEDGRVSRVLPVEAHARIAAAFAELSAARYSPALTLFNSARNAYDDRPRRDRDACANIFDALESAAKEKYGMPSATFGQVVYQIRQSGPLNSEVRALLGGLNDLRNRNFGHGMTAPFGLTGPEVDFAYLACIGAILLLVRMP